MNVMRPTILLCALVLSGALFGQVTSLEDAEMITRQYLSDKSASWGLTNADIAEMRLSSSHTSDHNGVTHVYMVQQYHGADIEYATYNANVLDGKSGPGLSKTGTWFYGNDSLRRGFGFPRRKLYSRHLDISARPSGRI